MRIEVAELQAAGLYDPAAPDAAHRLALLRWLVDRGATVPQLVRAARTGAVGPLVADLARGVGERLTLAEVSARTGVPAERIRMLRFAAGFPPSEPDDAALTEADARSLAVFDRAEELFGKDPTRRFVQVIGTSLARMAEAAVALTLAHQEAPIRRAGGGDLALLEARFRASETVGPLATAIAELFKGHVYVAARRIRGAQPAGSDVARLTVGFVDLVGFTTLSRRMEPRALAEVVESFEETARDVAAVHDARVVKFVGDEVMFVAESASAACEVALSLVERFVADESVTPRGGLAAGELLVRGGDYYGPVVNLAARMADVAIPREVLVTEPVRAAATGFRFEPAGRRVLKGFDEPVRLFAAER